MFGYFLKYLLTVIGLLLLVSILGVLGVLFQFWPTSWPDEAVTLTADKMNRLKQLRKERKFYATERPLFPGARSEGLRKHAENQVNTVIDKLIASLPKSPRKSHVLGIFKNALDEAGAYDSEEKDRMCDYLTQIMDILGIESSNELLNVWRYGLPHGWFAPKRVSS